MKINHKEVDEMMKRHFSSNSYSPSGLQRRAIYADRMAALGGLAGIVAGAYMGNDIIKEVPQLSEASMIIKAGVYGASSYAAANVAGSLATRVGDLWARACNFLEDDR